MTEETNSRRMLRLMLPDALTVENLEQVAIDEIVRMRKRLRRWEEKLLEIIEEDSEEVGKDEK